MLLHSPYSSLVKLVREKVSIVPAFLIKYKLNTLKNLEDVKCPTVIFHGRNDQLIPIHHSLLLKEKFPQLQLHILKNTGHNDVSEGTEYKQLLAKVLL